MVTFVTSSQNLGLATTLNKKKLYENSTLHTYVYTVQYNPCHTFPISVTAEALRALFKNLAMGLHQTLARSDDQSYNISIN